MCNSLTSPERAAHAIETLAGVLRLELKRDGTAASLLEAALQVAAQQ
jgi:hypothetical protein